MEQRSLRLGDNVDDYCPRERRVTNHVIVALVGDSIRQTRCATCDAEHEYREARMPRRKLKNGETSDLAGGVLVVPKPATGNGQAEDVPPAMPADPAPAVDATSASANEPSSGASDEAADKSGEPGADPLPGAWIGHRPLIRATLPRTENDVPPPRAIPEFTMHQRPGRGFGGRGFRGGFGGHGGGNGAAPPGRDGSGPDGNRAPRPGGPGGKSRHRRRHRRPR
jgi:hypothetical protein